MCGVSLCRQVRSVSVLSPTNYTPPSSRTNPIRYIQVHVKRLFNPPSQFSRLGILVSSSNFSYNCTVITSVDMPHGFLCIGCLGCLSFLPTFTSYTCISMYIMGGFCLLLLARNGGLLLCVAGVCGDGVVDELINHRTTSLCMLKQVMTELAICEKTFFTNCKFSH